VIDRHKQEGRQAPVSDWFPARNGSAILKTEQVFMLKLMTQKSFAKGVVQFIINK
jgi:hypothetical protein